MIVMTNNKALMASRVPFVVVPRGGGSVPDALSF